MTTFSAHVDSEGEVAADRERVWEILTDPQRLADLAPMIDSIRDNGDGTWTWYLAGFKALGKRLRPAFTECMELDRPEHIRYWHAPGDRKESAGAEGEYVLKENEAGTHLSISITVRVELPLPRVARSTVESVMRRQMLRMGDSFADNLERELA